MDQRIVIKIGSQVLCDAQGALNRGILGGLVEQVARLVTDGWQVLVVSSGAVAAGSGITASQLQRVSDPVVTISPGCAGIKRCRKSLNLRSPIKHIPVLSFLPCTTKSC